MQFLKKVVFAAGVSLAAAQAYAETEYVYFGASPGFMKRTETPEQDGIYAAKFNTKTGDLTPIGDRQAQLADLTWLLTNPGKPVIYSTSSTDGTTDNSKIFSYRIDTDTGELDLLGRADAGGKGSSHMSFDAHSGSLAIANYVSSSVAILPVNADGSLQDFASKQETYGTGTHSRQTAPRPHGVTFAPARDYVLVSDFGSDRIFVYKFDQETRQITPADKPFEQAPAGSAPRHITFDPSGQFVFVNMELTAELFVYRWNAQAGTLALVESVDMYPQGYGGHDRSTSGIVVSDDGRFLYAGLRGDQNAIVVYRINKQDGTLTETQRISSGGKYPWAFDIHPGGEWLLIANHLSDSVDVLGIDPKTGELSHSGKSMAVPGPMTLGFYQQGE